MILSCSLEARKYGRKSVPQGLKALIHLAQGGTASQAAEKFVTGPERRTSGAKARRILHHLRPD